MQSAPPSIEHDKSVRSSGIVLQPDIPLCQTDLPLDWYQEEFKPYAEEYLALPDRTPESVLPWLDSYVKPAQEHFGDALGARKRRATAAPCPACGRAGRGTPRRRA